MVSVNRLLFVVALITVILFGLFLLKRWQLSQARKAVNSSVKDIATSGKARIVYFWSTECNQCKTVQRPILDRLLTKEGETFLALTTVNVMESPEEATAWGVKTVPTTFILDKNGNVQHVNNGVASENKLLEQLTTL